MVSLLESVEDFLRVLYVWKVGFVSALVSTRVL